MRANLRDDLPPLPEKFKKLPIDPRGYPIPWFVGKVDGVYDFRLADSRKRKLAQDERLCWLCGEKLGRYMAFVIGPMCVVNRNTSEPGSHLDCARFAATACPHLSRPEAKSRTANLPTKNVSRLPEALDGNPGGCAVYVTHESWPYIVPGTRNEWLIRLGEPSSVEWYVRGRHACLEEVEAILTARLPLLREIAESQGPRAVEALAEMVEIARKTFPPSAQDMRAEQGGLGVTTTGLDV